jgi:hypothetical protein
MKAKTFNRFNVAHGGICGLVAGMITGAVSGGGFSPMLVLLIMGFFLIGNAKFGPENLSDLAGLKAALVASAIWPYLAWKNYDLALHTPSATTYDVFVNKIFVGTLTNAEYFEIKRSAFRDPRVYIAQILNIGRIACKILDSFVVGVPVLAFWSLFCLSYFEPTMYAKAIAILQQGPVANSNAMESYFSILLWLCVIVLLFKTIFLLLMRMPGFENKFDQAVAKQLRHVLRVPTEGEVKMIRQDRSPIRAVAQS